MKFGPRIPSLTKRIAARTSIKRAVRHSLGFKAPRGFGWFTNPKKALYNRIYNRTTFSIDDLFREPRKTSTSAPSPTGSYHSGDSTPRRSGGTLGAIAIVGLIIAGVVLATHHSSPPPPPTVDPARETPAATPSLPIRLLAKTCKLREAGSVGSPALGSIMKGQGVEVMNTEGHWQEVRVGARQGWVHQSCLLPEP
jgi:hypothetical protein